MAQEVEHLPSNWKALSSNPRTVKGEKKNTLIVLWWYTQLLGRSWEACAVGITPTLQMVITKVSADIQPATCAHYVCC
jgi:hypothetical protein